MAQELARLELLWVPDNFSCDCMDCKVMFGFSKRRHHCRACGLLFCRDCVRLKTRLPVAFGYGDLAQRCCQRCMTGIQTGTITTPADIFTQRQRDAAALAS
ncbi:hypothetical protein PINS_up022189 [Pythium insidiosum]|nr:hypothetical protein PINS_up022189 [Pythium insidiosum]